MSHRPVNLLVISTTLNTGGAQRFASTLLSHLDRSRIQPSLCLLRDDIGYPIPDDVAVTALAYRRPWHFLGTVRRLREHIETTRPDVILSNIAATNLVAGLALMRCRHRPRWIARIGNSPSRHDGLIRSLIARRVYPVADRLVVNSIGLVDDLMEQYSVELGRIDVLGNPTDFAAIDTLAAEASVSIWNRREPLLIAVGRLCEQKRYDVMLRALARVVEQVPAHLWICGDGPERERLRNLAGELGLAEQVTFLGFVKNPYALMRQATLFVMSSDHEGLPNSLIEAQGLGLPAVSTQCPHGPDEIIEHGETGLLTPVADPETLAEAILQLLQNESRRVSMGTAAAEVARARFDAATIAGRWSDLIESTLSVQAACLEGASSCVA
jgi:glycosyltransferase involved in cell wall biosynthesis